MKHSRMISGPQVSTPTEMSSFETQLFRSTTLTIVSKSSPGCIQCSKGQTTLFRSFASSDSAAHFIQCFSTAILCSVEKAITLLTYASFDFCLLKILWCLRWLFGEIVCLTDRIKLICVFLWYIIVCRETSLEHRMYILLYVCIVMSNEKGNKKSRETLAHSAPNVLQRQQRTQNGHKD